MERACGFYDQLHQALHDGELNVNKIEELYNENHITQEQYRFAKEYLGK